MPWRQRHQQYETEQKVLWKVFLENEKCKDQSPKFDQGRKETNAKQGKPEEPEPKLYNHPIERRLISAARVHIFPVPIHFVRYVRVIKDLVHFHVNPLVNHVVKVGWIAPKPPEHN